MRVALKGLMGADYLKNLGQKTARSMRANAERGLATGSRLYGYASQPGGAVQLVDQEADVVRRIYRDYADGLTALDIAAALNREGVPGPRGGPWNKSTIVGSRSRANGILHTELYAGVKVYNRVQMRKDPRTGKRLPRIRPAGEWVRVPVDHLRIVPESLWQAVQARLAEAAAAPPWTLSHGRRKGLFSGLVRCSCCGGGYITFGAGRLRCASRLERGPEACTNARTLSRAQLERRVLQGLQARLLRPERVAAYVRAYHAAWQARRAQDADRRAPLERRAAELARSSQRLADAIARGISTPELEAKVMAEQLERRRLQAELAMIEADAPPPVELHPRAAELYAQRIGELQQLLEEAAGDGAHLVDLRLRDAIRGLIDRIEVEPTSAERGAPVRIWVHGRLAAFLQPPGARPAACMGVMVAGGSNSLTPTFEPPAIKVAC
jgi:site-specific DNA recombinase